jgi:hypothetical protein
VPYARNWLAFADKQPVFFGAGYGGDRYFITQRYVPDRPQLPTDTSN